MKTGYWEVSPGNKSNSRKDGSIVIYVALFLASYVVIYGLYRGEDVLTVCSAASALFFPIAGSAMAYTFKQKQTEEANKAVNKTTEDSI